MRKIFAGLILVFACSALQAAELELGDATISVRSPAGMARLTPDVQPLYGVSQDMTAPANFRLATFVDDAVIPNALTGEMPAFERYINVETLRTLRTTNVTAADFVIVKKSMRETLDATFLDIESKLPDGMAAVSDRVSDTLDLDVALSVSNMVPLPIHQETARAVANSSILKYEIDDGSGARELIVTTTMTMVLVKNRLLFVYVYGGPDDLEWTRSQAQKWVDSMISLNAIDAVANGG